MQKAGVDGGSVEAISSESESTNSTSSKNKSSRKRRKKEMLSDEALFKKLESNVPARSNLASIHAAGSHKYGHVQFGQKK